MGAFESTRCSLDPREERILARMVRDRRRAQPPADEDVEISGAEPPEEAHAKRFDRGPSRALGAEVWGYPYSRNYASELYNFAWARAVQNKPLGIELVGPASPSEDEEEEEKLVQDVVVSAEDGAEVSGEKEEGELEEGEIEFVAEAAADGALSELEELEEDKGVGEEDEDGVEEMGEFDRLVSSILEELEAVTEEEVEKSFEEICTRLRKSFERLKQMVSETHVLPVINALVQQAFMGIQTAHSVVSSGSSKNVEQDKDLLLRLLIHIKNQYHILLTPEQSTEIDTMVKSLVFDNDTKDKETNGWIRGNANNSGNIAEKVERTRVDLRAFKAGLPKLELPASPRIKAEFSPLLDLHGAYDEGSLPSPTRENPPPLPMHRPSGVGMGSAFFTQPITPMNIETEDTILHSSMMDPLKAVSSYQQKYGQTSLFSSNQLPSPTPSEESNDGNDNDLHGEVSSFSAAGNARPLNPQTSSPFDRFTSGGDFAPNWSAHQQPSLNILGQLGSSPNPMMKSTIKCRDPRLRFINSEVGGAPNSDRHLMSVASDAPKNGVLGETANCRKHKALDKSVLDDHTLKKQRNDNMDSRNMQGALRRDGLLEDSNVATHQPSSMIRLSGNVQLDNRRPESGEIGFISSERRPDANTKCNASTVGVGQNPSGSTVGSVYSPFLLKDFHDIAAVNPTMLIQLLQKRLAAETKQKTADPMHFLSRNTLCETVPALNAAPTKSSEVNQNQAGQPQMPAKPVTMNDGGKIRMKPRDPRRMLHNNMVQNSENGGFKQSKTDGTLSLDTQKNKDNIKTREQVEQARTTGLPSQPTSVPDIAQQFTKNLADIIASTQLTNNSPGFTQNNAQPIPSKLDKADVTCPTAEELNKADMTRPTAEASNQKSATTSSCEVGTSGASQSPNAWGNVDHLLDGYDDQQKAAIQRERVRRIEEQNKMFAAWKLCLVLDLDHTLLNSAKFAEVDPVHDEILRKKEELDRDKPPRHLFRFPHMGMWTKLRPGIWNFLEKASKLYELHVYTMGNKLYATEMAKVLDPTGALFAGRVISRGDDSDLFDGDDRVPKSKDLDGVLGMESAVVIIDDSVRVWPHNKLNLIVVERYTYFPCSRRQFGLLGPSLLEIDHDERPEDGTLASSLAVIERIHQNFFSHRSLKDVDVRNILAAEQRKILSGCKIVFSRVFPVGETNPHLHPLWQTAEQFGAVCTNQVDEQVTHVVANSLGTDKVNWALSNGRFIVHPGWVEASALLYRRANELDFVVKQ